MTSHTRPLSCFCLGGLLLLLCLCLCYAPLQAAAQPQIQPETQTDTPLMQHPAWKRLDALSSQLSFAWSRRYLELKSIAQDTDLYTQRVPFKLEKLHTVTVAAQHNVVTLLLDLVPAQPNVQESAYIVSLLQQWYWRLEVPLNDIAPIVNTLDHFLALLDSLHQAVDEIPAIIEQRPDLKEGSLDFIEVYTLTHQRAKQLRGEIRQVRSVARALSKQIDEAVTAARKRFPAQWLAYYTNPLVVTQGALARIGVDFIAMCVNLTYDDGFPAGVSFTLILTAVTLCALWLCHIYMHRLATAPQPHHAGKTGFQFFRALCKMFYTLDAGRRLALACGILVTVNTLVDNLPQFHLFIPFAFVQQIFLITALALWARTSPDAPRIWEMVLPIATGLILLHGDASALLVLLGMGGAVLLPLASILLRGAKGHCVLRKVWLGVLLLSLPLILLGLGRLVTGLLLCVVILAASTALLRFVNNSTALHSHMLARAIFVPVLTFIICIVTLNVMTACSGVEFLLEHWYDNPITVLGIKIDFANALLTLFFLLGLFFFSNIALQFFESLARRRHILDTSAVPVLHAVVNCTLWGIFAIFIMRAMGVDVSNLAFIGGGFTVGVGIAAKTVLGNFFSGLVIIFSRVVRAGDLVEVNGVLGRVHNVNMRATVLETVSSGILLVPNEEMLNSRVTNWTLNHRHVCEEVPISVSTQSNVDSVLAAMQDAALGHTGALSDPPPKAYFVGFGDNSMNFVLRVWIGDVSDKLPVLSAVRQTLCRLFAERGIALASAQLEVTMTNLHEKA